MLIREYFAQRAEPADCEVRVLFIIEDLNIASALDAPAEMASLHLPLPATSSSSHTHHLSGVFRLERGEVKRLRSVRELLEAEPSYTDELLRFRLLHIQAEHWSSADASLLWLMPLVIGEPDISLGLA